MTIHLEGFDEVELSLWENGREDGEILRFDSIGNRPCGTDRTVEAHLMSDDLRRLGRISRHHDRADAKIFQFRDQGD